MIPIRRVYVEEASALMTYTYLRKERGIFLLFNVSYVFKNSFLFEKYLVRADIVLKKIVIVSWKLFFVAY